MGWDQKLNPDQIKVIHDILVDLRRVTEFVFPRHILYEHTELHVFTDASSRAYGAAVYTVDQWFLNFFTSRPPSALCFCLAPPPPPSALFKDTMPPS